MTDINDLLEAYVFETVRTDGNMYSGISFEDLCEKTWKKMVARVLMKLIDDDAVLHRYSNYYPAPPREAFNTQCDKCGDESNSEPELTCGRIETDEETGTPTTEPCQGRYRTLSKGSYSFMEDTVKIIHHRSGIDYEGIAGNNRARAGVEHGKIWVNEMHDATVSEAEILVKCIQGSIKSCKDL